MSKMGDVRIPPFPADQISEVVYEYANGYITTDEEILEWMLTFRLFDPQLGETVCPKCQRVADFKAYMHTRAYWCPKCGYGLSPLSGTIFEQTQIPLVDWCRAIIMMDSAEGRKISKRIGVSYNTACTMRRKIRSVWPDIGQ